MKRAMFKDLEAMEAASPPSRGAWIETWSCIPSIRDRAVAPLAGAWIET